MHSTVRLTQHFGAFLRKRGYSFSTRRSTESHYFEVHMGRSVILVRISTHENTSQWHPWEPDLNITDNRSFNQAKAFIKKTHTVLTARAAA